MRGITKTVRALKRVTLEDVVLSCVALLLCAIFILPFLSVLAKSLSSERAVLTGEVEFFPVEIQFSAYSFALSTNRFFRALCNSVLVTVVGTLLAMGINSMAAFVLAHGNLRGIPLVRGMILFTMIFSAGIVPGYLVVKTIGLLDTYGALILPAIASPYNLLIMISFVRGLSPTFEESARIDGASDFQIFFRIVLPLCKPMLASIALFTAVGYWNDYFRPMIFVHDESRFTLALYLRQILQNAAEINKTLDTAVYGNVAPESVQNSTIIISTLPILLVYPFVQRFFVTGITLGGVKE